MPHDDDSGTRRLNAAAQGVLALIERPRTVTFSIASLMVIASWAVLVEMGVLAAKTSLGGESGPGGWILRMVPDIALPSAFTSFFALCLGTVDYQPGGLSVFPALWTMWFMMALAMMLPSAAPMIRTYCDIAETARSKSMKAVHPVILLGGYLSVWGLIAAFFAGLTLALNRFGATETFAYPVEGFVAPAALALAGIYQFSGLKDACLTKCRNPFATLFGRWSDRAGAVFKLGAQEGLYCAGCCWALMLVMFAVGTMNVFWMALLTLLAIVEKSNHAQWVTHAIGVILLVWAAALMFIHI